MRLVVFSDTHHNTALFQRAVEQAVADGPIDCFIHCGDGVRDLECVEGLLLRSNPRLRLLAVRGNCDLGAQAYPVTELTELAGVRVMITHGHTFQVKHGLGALAKAAKEMNVQLVCFGHTHQPTVTEKHGVTLVNPGALNGYTYTDSAYLELLIDPHKIIRYNFIKRR